MAVISQQRMRRGARKRIVVDPVGLVSSVHRHNQVQALDLASCASTATLSWIQLDKDKDRDKRGSV